MSARTSFARRCARKLVSHAARVLPPHRDEWARAMRSEVDLLSHDSTALRWAVGAVVASYLDRIRLMRNFALSAALVLAGLVMIEGSHLLMQYLFQERIIELLMSAVPVSFLTDDSGGYAPMGVLLTITISAPVSVVAFIVGLTLFRMAPERARAAIKAIVVTDAIFLAAAILVSLSLQLSNGGSVLAAIPSTTILWAVRVVLVAVPLLGLLFARRLGKPAAAAA